MLPIVHGLEKKLSNDFAFLYFDVSLPETAEVQKRFGFDGSPHFLLLDAKGAVLSERKYKVMTAAVFEEWMLSVKKP